jgi:hypothetical protein
MLKEKRANAFRYMGEIEQIICDVLDADLEDERRRLFCAVFKFGDFNYNFLDLVILESQNKNKILEDGVIKYFASIGINSDFIGEDQKDVVLEKAILGLEALQVNQPTQFEKCIKKLVEGVIENRHSFDDLKRIVINKDFVPSEGDVEILEKLKKKMDSKDNQGCYIFNSIVRNTFDEVCNLVLAKLPNENLQKQELSSVINPKSAIPVASQQHFVIQ